MRERGRKEQRNRERQLVRQAIAWLIRNPHYDTKAQEGEKQNKTKRENENGDTMRSRLGLVKKKKRESVERARMDVGDTRTQAHKN